MLAGTRSSRILIIQTILLISVAIGLLLTAGPAWTSSFRVVREHQPVVSGQGHLYSSTLPCDCNGHDIPIVVLSHNNPTLLNLSVSQLRSCFDATVIILDLGSDYPGMLSYLENVTADARVSVIRHNNNAGPHTLFGNEGSSYLKSLPRFFAMTDPDLRLGDYTPSNFMCVLAHMTQRAQRAKAGVALDVTEPHRMWKWRYMGSSIRTWEMSLYKSTVTVPGWPQLDGLVYTADVDTTLAVYDKAQLSGCPAPDGPAANCFPYHAVRLSGVFTALHRPWYPEAIGTIPLGELQAMYKDKKGTIGRQYSADVYTVSSTWNVTDHSAAGRDPFVVHDPMSFKCLGKSFVFPTPATGTPLRPSSRR